MRLLTAVSLVRVQQGEPKKKALKLRVSGLSFILYLLPIMKKHTLRHTELLKMPSFSRKEGILMATIIENKKDGKVVSYKFRAYLGKQQGGKQVAKYHTWQVPDGLTPAKARKAAEKAAAEWEKEARFEYERDVKEPERAAIREIENQRTDFVGFVDGLFFPVCLYDGNHKQTTITYYESLSKGIKTYFKGYALQTITPIDIKKYLIYLQTKHRTPLGNTASPKTVRHIYCLLAMIFKFAKEQDYIVKNPIDKVDCPKLTKKKVDALTKEEAAAFFAAVNDCPIDFQCMLYLMITAGLRRGELAGLQWRDIDFDNLTVSIERNAIYTPASGIIINTPKTENSARVIPLLPKVAALLKAYKEQHFQPKDSLCFVFHGKGGKNEPRLPDGITERVKAFMKRSGFRDLSPHDLRHSCGTLLIANGADIKSVQEILGHTDASTTLNFYVRTDLEQMKEATNKMAEAFGL